MKRAAQNSPRRGFTLIEIMVVVAIMGLIMAMGVPTILAAVKKDGMRKAISDLQDVFSQARGQAIMQNKIVSVVFHPQDRSFETASGGAGSSASKVSSGTLPSGVDWPMLDINQMDFTGEDIGWVRFFPDGTCEDVTIVLHDKDQFRKLTLEYSTGIPMITDVTQ